MATTTRMIEIFSAGCDVCATAVERIRSEACDSCDVRVLDMGDEAVACRAKDLGIASLPAVVVDGQVAQCCSSRGIDIDVLRKAGLGQSLS